MSIFIDCKNEEIIQVKDKTRIDASQSFVSGDDITSIEIKPSAADDYMSVFDADSDNWYLDWAYASAGDKVITVRASDGTDTVTETYSITAIGVADDNLYSNDSQIFEIESELKRYIPVGRNSYKNIHRAAQSRIISYLDRKRIWNTDAKPYTKDQLNMENELTKWSLYETIYIIYTDLFMSAGDKFQEKMNQYRDLRNAERNRSSIRIDTDKDGTFDKDKDDIQDLKSFRMIRR